MTSTRTVTPCARWTRRWRTAPLPASERLPILAGVQADDVQLGRQTESPKSAAALRLLPSSTTRPWRAWWNSKRINVAVPDILQVTTSQGTQVTFSLSHFDAQLRRWRAIYDQYQKWGQAIASLDLSIANNLPVRWVAAQWRLAAAAAPAGQTSTYQEKTCLIPPPSSSDWKSAPPKSAPWWAKSTPPTR